MINLMPPTAKEQLRYAKYNRSALRYLQLVVVVVVIIAAIFATAIMYLDRQVVSVTTDLTSKQQTIAGFSNDKLTAANAAARVNAIKTIEGGQTRFSQLLYDLAAVLPKGISLTGIALTGDSSKPVVVSINGSTYNEILAFHDAIVTSPRISGADLQSITSTSTGYQANVVLGFNPGEAK
ncbi:PilN domain-containing protein [Candidatus Saccharibacteria bacterium]|nr:PilN domain-containing protein [Candidatus Saccharibacteria bacterium]